MEWISVENKLPNKGDYSKCLVENYLNDKIKIKVTFAKYLGDLTVGPTWDIDTGDEAYAKVTHWKPIEENVLEGLSKDKIHIRAIIIAELWNRVKDYILLENELNDTVHILIRKHGHEAAVAIVKDNIREFRFMTDSDKDNYSMYYKAESVMHELIIKLDKIKK